MLSMTPVRHQAMIREYKIIKNAVVKGLTPQLKYHIDHRHFNGFEQLLFF